MPDRHPNPVHALHGEPSPAGGPAVNEELVARVPVAASHVAERPR